MTESPSDRPRPLAGGAGWRGNRLLPIAVAVVAIVPGVALTGSGMARSAVVLSAVTLGALVAVWQRQAAALSRERDLSHVVQSLRQDVGHPPRAALERGEPRSLRQQLTRVERTLEVALETTSARQAETARSVEEVVRREVERAERRRRTDDRHTFAQVEASLNLFAQLPPQARMPGLRGWALSPDLLLVVVELLRQRRPRLVVELGGGSSTIWLGHAIRQFGLATRVVTLEHDEAWVRTVQERIEAHGLQEVAQVRRAPLVDQVLDDQTFRWYDPAAWQDLSGIDLLLVDGPPAAIGEQARYPALPLLVDRLAPDALVVLDDAIRTDEQQIAERWLPLLDGFTRLDLPVEKKAIVFYRGAPPAL